MGELARLHGEFRQGDYSAFMEALLLCCWNQRALPEWLATVVIEQSEATFAKNATGHGRQGNWRAALHAKQVDDHRANMVALHLWRGSEEDGSSSPKWHGCTTTAQANARTIPFAS